MTPRGPSAGRDLRVSASYGSWLVGSFADSLIRITSVASGLFSALVVDLVFQRDKSSCGRGHEP